MAHCEGGGRVEGVVATDKVTAVGQQYERRTTGKDALAGIRLLSHISIHIPLNRISYLFIVLIFLEIFGLSAAIKMGINIFPIAEM